MSSRQTRSASSNVPGTSSEFSDSNILAASAEFIPGRFYFVVLKSMAKPKYTQNSHYFTIDDELVYDPFYEDFGPLNLAHLYRYCRRLNEKLQAFALLSKKIVHYTCINPQKRVNAAYLAGSYAILYLKMSPNEAYQKLTKSSSIPYVEFRDASVGYALYTISLLDCLNAVYHAKRFHFFDFKDFSVSEYEHFETVENGDLNWIIPGKFLAFAGPQTSGYHNRNISSHLVHTPESYFEYFREHSVTTIVRLNNKMYDAGKFTEKGFLHQDLFFFDGSTPSDDLMHRFLEVAEQSTGAVAVHCKAGLGRTGTMIACYLMKWYHFTAKESIAWLRICRPASIIGHQQEWLESKQQEMWSYRAHLNPPKHKVGIYSFHDDEEAVQSTCDSMSRITDRVTSMTIDTNKDVNKNPVGVQQHEKIGGVTQGDRLNQIKASRSTSRSAQTKMLRLSRLSWPNNAVNGTAKKSAPIGKVTPPKKNLTRNKSCSSISAKINSEENKNVLASASSDVNPPLRSNPKSIETRINKSVSHR